MTTQQKIEFFYTEYIREMPRLCRLATEGHATVAQEAIIKTYENVKKQFETMFYEEIIKLNKGEENNESGNKRENK